MISETHEKDLIEIADKLGYEEQSMQLIEEMAELTQAISKYRRYNDTEEVQEFVKEASKCDFDIDIFYNRASIILRLRVHFTSNMTCFSLRRLGMSSPSNFL